jgi:hypothetical protein
MRESEFGSWRVRFAYTSKRSGRLVHGDAFFLANNKEEALRVFTLEWGSFHPTVVDILLVD